MGKPTVPRGRPGSARTAKGAAGSAKPGSHSGAIPEGRAAGTPPEAHLCVVGIGASAGGLEALKRFFAAVPLGTNLSYVVVMHLPPSRRSMLDEILARTTPLNVCHAEDGMAPEPDTVYVAPPRREITLQNGVLRLEEPKSPERVHKLIDIFFTSLAAAQRERAIALILSGTGADGSLGARAVKEVGGTVIVQDEASAAYPDMPRNAAAAGAVDHVLPVDKMPERIMALACPSLAAVARSTRPAELDALLGDIFRIVKARTGHDFSPYKVSTVLRRIERRMAATSLDDLAGYRNLLSAVPQESGLLCKEMLIGVTSFFRDPDAFAVLRSRLFPRIFADRDPDDPVRIWHASCSTGEEVYSMAILVREYLDEHKLDVPIQFFATDIDEVAIADARAGIYPAAIGAELSPERLQRYFVRTDAGYRVAKQLREMIVFAPHSLIKDPPFSRLDLLVCRNFLIYLKADMQQRLISLFHLALKPGGFLFLGSSETTRHFTELFSPVDQTWKIYERLPGDQKPEAPLPFHYAQARLAGAHHPHRPAIEEFAPAAIVEKLLLDRYSPPCVVVDDRHDVAYVSTRPNRFLEVPVGTPTRDLLKMARKELRPLLRSAIQKAFDEQKKVAIQGIRCGDAGDEAAVNLLVEPLGALPPARKLAMVVFEPATERPPLAQAPEKSDAGRGGDESAKDRLIRQLEEQLFVSHEQLQATIEQLESANEGLMSTNEELLSINEEFQSTNEELHSTNEELETSREELQALNEELVTVNAELQQKVAELDQANGDMDNLLTCSEIATIFLDRELRIKRFTPAMAELFSLIPADCNRPFHHLSGKVEWPGFDEDLEAVLSGRTPIEREVASHRGTRHNLARVLPYRTSTGNIDGVVVTLIDITQRKRDEEALLQSEANYRRALDTMLEGCQIIGFDWRYRYINAAAERHNKLPKEEMLDRSVVECWPGFTETRVFALEKSCMEERTTHQLDNEFIFPDGQPGWFRLIIQPVPDGIAIYSEEITDRKLAEQALRESREQLGLFIKHAPAALAMFDREMRYLHASRRWLTDYRLGDIDLIGKSHYEIFPEIPDRWKDAHRRGLAGEVLRADADRFPRADGSEQWLQWEIRPWYDATGDVGGIVIFTEDITDRKMAEETLRESEVRVRRKLDSILTPEGDTGELELADIIDTQSLQSLVDDFYKLSGMPMGLIDITGKVLVGVGWQRICTKFHRVNPETCRNCVESDTRLSAGVPPGEYKIYKCKNNMWDVATPVMVGGRHLGNLFMGQFFFEDEPLDYDFFRSQAQRYGFDEEEYIGCIEAAPRLSRETLDTSMAFFMRLADILSKLGYSNLKLARSLAEGETLTKSLREQEEIYGVIVNNAADGIVLVDPETLRFVEFNDAACAGLGYSREEFAGMTLRDVHEIGAAGDIRLDLPGPDAWIAQQREHRHRRKNGDLRDVRVSRRNVTVGGKRCLLSIWHDITDHKRAEEEREKAARLESLGLLAGGIAHDFNNILTAVIGNISLARTKIGEDHPAARQLASCEAALDKATYLTRQLLTFSRGGEPVKGPVETERLIREVASFGLHGSNCTKNIDIEPGLWNLGADAGQIHQALNNLIINAVQAMPDGGVLTCSAANEPVGEDNPHDLPAGRYVRLTLADQGCGIPPDILPRIFDPYFTTKPTGTGLGLASVFSIIKRHEGAIEVASLPGRGTTFTIFLPATDGHGPASTDGQTERERPPVIAVGRSVLVMDDEEMIRSLAADMLDKLGYGSVTCADGAEAVEIYRRALEKGDPFSVVILDMTVPGGMGGKEAAERILALDPGAVLVVSTGYSVDSAYSGKNDPVFGGAVSKPYNVNQLSEELARLTGRAS